MKTWVRRVRGALGMGATWALALGFLGGVPRWVFGVDTDAPIPILLAAFGFVAGVIFSGLLALTEGRRTFNQLSPGRVAGWGALGGALLSALFLVRASLGWGEALLVVPVFTLAGAACAAGSLALARRAASPEGPALADDTSAGLARRGEGRALGEGTNEGGPTSGRD